MLSTWNHTNLASVPAWLWKFWAALLFPVSLNSHLWFTSLWQLYWRISSFLIHLLPYLLSHIFLISCGPLSSIPQPGLLPWKCLSFSKLNCWIFLCVALPGCTGFSPLQLSGINVHIILRQPPWFPIQLKFVLVFKACLRHASGSLIQFVSLCSSSCSSWFSSTWFHVSLQELCVFLEIFTRTIQLNKKLFCFMLHSHPFGSSIEGEFASRNICRCSKSEEYRSKLFLEYKYKYLQRKSALGDMFFQLGSRAIVTWPLCPSKIWNTFHILKKEFSHGASCKPFTDPWLDCGAAPHALNREQFKATQEEPKRLSLQNNSSSGWLTMCGGEQFILTGRNRNI